VGTTVIAAADDLSAGAGAMDATVRVEVAGTSVLTVGVVSGAGEVGAGWEPRGSVTAAPWCCGIDAAIAGGTLPPVSPAGTGPAVAGAADAADAAGPASRVAMSDRSARLGEVAAVLTRGFSVPVVDWASTSWSVGFVGCVGPG